MNTYEVNFDGLIGPTHNYGGQSFGNLASERNARRISHPKQAAMQGLEKMRVLINRGYKQGFLLPQARPDIAFLRRLGFRGSDSRVLTDVAAQTPELLPLVYSASSMWAANAATVTPSTDSRDGKLHFTPANLQTTAHRAIEHPATRRCLETIFSDTDYFRIHPALPAHTRFADEGAANHTRLCEEYSRPGVALFVYGRDKSRHSSVDGPAGSLSRRQAGIGDYSSSHCATSFSSHRATGNRCAGDRSIGNLNANYPARQTLEASRAIARQHRIQTALFLQQNPAAIEAGAFHNDVVAVGNGPVLLFHEQAFEATSRAAVFAELSRYFSSSAVQFQPLRVPASRISLADAVNTYLFNSQLLAAPDGDMHNMLLLAPTESEQHPATREYLNELIEDPSNPIGKVDFVDVRQSMANGGGPACLRLRVVMNEGELAAMHPAFLLNNAGIDRLQHWVQKHYRDTLAPDDLRDPQLLEECYTALDELTHLLAIGAFYPFQK